MDLVQAVRPLLDTVGSDLVLVVFPIPIRLHLGILSDSTSINLVGKL